MTNECRTQITRVWREVDRGTPRRGLGAPKGIKVGTQQREAGPIRFGFLRGETEGRERGKEETEVVSKRRVVERTPDIRGALFGDWVETIVKRVDAGRNTTVEEYANRIAKDNGGTRAPREALWTGQERGFRTNEGRSQSYNSREGRGGDTRMEQREQEMVIWKRGDTGGVEDIQGRRRGKNEGYRRETGEWVGWGDPGPAGRHPNWKPTYYERHCSNCGFLKCKGCTQNSTHPRCEECHLAHECPKHPDKPIQRKKQEEEIRVLRERDNLQTGEGLTEELSAELKDNRYKDLTATEICETLRARMAKGKHGRIAKLNEEPLIDLGC